MRNATLLRWLAIAMAVAAVIDPVITSRRRVDAVVALIAADSSASPLTDQLGRDLARTFTIVRAPLGAAAATVVVGDRLPDGAPHSGGVAYAVLPADEGVTLERVRAPARAPLHSRVAVIANVRGSGRADVTLRQGDVALDHVTLELPARDTLLDVPLTFVPTQAGALPLRVEVVSSAGVRNAADVLIDVRETRWPVLFYEARPSWMSTFVRRALEQDPRFVVTSRTLTSRDVATEFGRPPRRLDDLADAGEVAVLVIGAPEVLADAEIAHIERYLRRSGGSAVFLVDRPVPGAYRALTGPGPWVTRVTRVLSTTDSAAPLRATTVIRPATLPPRAVPVALRYDEPLVWRVPVGAGRVVVNGALDAWRFRDPETSRFDEFWRSVMAQEAASAPPPLDAALTRNAVRPGETMTVNVTARDAALASDSVVRTRASATIDESGAHIRLWPGERIGELVGGFRAPAQAGSYTVSVTDGTERVLVPFVVRTDAAVATGSEPELLRAWTASRGGEALTQARAGELRGLIQQAVRAERRAEAWHPMRSPWWIVPFALALGFEWWVRRRRGMP